MFLYLSPFMHFRVDIQSLFLQRKFFFKLRLSMEKSEKEYGKLSLDQFKLLVQELPELRKKLKELPKLLRTISEEEKNEILSKDLSWANVYERSFNEQLALLV